MLFFKSHKIDFKTLKSIDKVIKKEADLIDWIKCYSENKSKFSRSDYKLLEEESETLIIDEFKSFIEWRGFNQLDDDYIIKSINRNESMPNILKFSEGNDIDSTRVSVYSSHNGISSGKVTKEHFKAKTSTPINKAIVNIYHHVTKKYKILHDIKINPISNKPFYANLINVHLLKV